MSYAIDAVEYRMSISLKQTLKTITKNDQGIEELLSSHFLKGNFLKLTNSKLFYEILFPGLPMENIHTMNIPKNFKEVIEWDQITIDEKKIIKNAKEVLSNIQKKGKKEGQMMDEPTERILLPQIVQEALATHIIDSIRALNRKISNTVAQLSHHIASSESLDAKRNQLESIVITDLLKQKFCIQREYLGHEWSKVISKDCTRFCQYEKLTNLDEYGNMMIEDLDHERVSSSSSSSSAWTQICWIELDEYLQKYYPAISIAVDQLYALPHELNAKYIWDGPSFLEVNRGCTMLVRYPVGSSQAIRLDCRANNLKLDSGIRMTAIYHIRRQHDNDLNPIELDSSTGLIIFTPNSSNSKKVEGITVHLEDDILTLHHSTDIKNERVRANEEWYALIFFMHGKLS